MGEQTEGLMPVGAFALSPGQPSSWEASVAWFRAIMSSGIGRPDRESWSSDNGFLAGNRDSVDKGLLRIEHWRDLIADEAQDP